MASATVAHFRCSECRVRSAAEDLTLAAPKLLALLDDIATLLDDVAAMTKVATRKTAGVLSDDLALNAEQVAGVRPDRELPVVWAVAKGSALNKCILVPAALLISAFVPWLVVPLLMLGGGFLCFEGFEKVFSKLLQSKEAKEKHHQELVAAVSDPAVDLVELEKTKIRGAIRTDFILSAEILVIALGTAADASLARQALMLVAIAVTFTVFVYGLVAGIVKLDDMGLALSRKESAVARGIGRAIIAAAPYLMKALSIGGTIAMFLVGGGIVVHGVPALDAVSKQLTTQATALSGTLGSIVPTLFNGVVGLLVGGVLVALFTLGSRVVKRFRPSVATS